MRTILKSGLAAIGAIALAAPVTAEPEERATGVKIARDAERRLRRARHRRSQRRGPVRRPRQLGLGRICYSLSAANIGDSTGAHIHSGAAGAVGDPVLTLDTPDGDDEDSEECQDIDKSLA